MVAIALSIRAAGQDATSAAKQLAKAFADPVAGAKSLDAVFGTISASTLIAIDDMTKHNNVNRAAGTDVATAGTVALPATLERDLRTAARDADEVTATARALQDWVRKNGFAQ